MKIGNTTVNPRALLGELVGTFILVLAAVNIANPLIVGFVMLVLVLGFWKISGSHVNPAVTFGLWSVKKFDTILVPFYWAMQFVGALLAVIVNSFYTGDSYALSFASFGNIDARIFVAELIGAAVFLFFVAAAVNRDLSDTAKSLAIGIGLATGLFVGTSLVGLAAQNPTLYKNGKDSVTPQVAKISGTTANPAVALASKEKKTQQANDLNQGQSTSDTNEPSQLTLGVILGTLLGGAIGANLYMVLAGVNVFGGGKTKSSSVASKISSVTKSTKTTAKRKVKAAKKKSTKK